MIGLARMSHDLTQRNIETASTRVRPAPLSGVFRERLRARFLVSESKARGDGFDIVRCSIHPQARDENAIDPNPAPLG
jgi:hypothetical protein